jgi:hypothetical protein
MHISPLLFLFQPGSCIQQKYQDWYCSSPDTANSNILAPSTKPRALECPSHAYYALIAFKNSSFREMETSILVPLVSIRYPPLPFIYLSIQDRLTIKE